MGKWLRSGLHVCTGALSLRDMALKQDKTFDETLKMKSVSHYITKSRVVTASINRAVPFLHAPSYAF